MSIASWMKEVLGINSDDARRVEIMLANNMTGAGQASAQYRVPAGTKLVITGLRGHLAVLEPTFSTVDAPTPYPQDAIGMISVLAMNCRVKLINNDTQAPVTENADLSLADLVTSIGGSPIDWKESPLVVPGGQTLRMDTTLVSNIEASALGVEYGVVLSGVLLKTGAAGCKPCPK